MTELVLSCPRFTRNLSGQRADRILCPSWIPALAVHWSANGLGDIGRRCPFSRVIHWVKSSPDQAGQFLANQSFPCLVWEINLTQHFYFWLIYIGRRSRGFFYLVLPFFLNFFPYLIQTYFSLFQLKLISFLGTVSCIKMDLTFNPR